MMGDGGWLGPQTAKRWQLKDISKYSKSDGQGRQGAGRGWDEAVCLVQCCGVATGCMPEVDNFFVGLFLLSKYIFFIHLS